MGAMIKRGARVYPRAALVLLIAIILQQGNEKILLSILFGIAINRC